MDTIDEFFALVNDLSIEGTSIYKQAVYSHYILYQMHQNISDTSLIKDVIDYNMLTDSTFRSKMIDLLKEQRYDDIQQAIILNKNKIISTICFI